WRKLRDRYREPEPKPRQRKLDTQVQAARDATWARWDAWADSRIEAYLHDIYNQAVGEVIEMRCHVHRDRLLTLIAALRKDLDATRAELKTLKAAKRSKHVETSE